MSKSPSVKFLFPWIIIFPSLMILTSSFEKAARQLLSHNCPTDSNDEFVNDGRTCANFADASSLGIGNVPSCSLLIIELFGR